MEASTLLLTGSTGLIGFPILLQALKAGYIVRTVVRSQERAAKLLGYAEIERAKSNGRLHFEEMPNFEDPHAWTSALEGVDFVIHTASPLPLPHLHPENDIYLPISRGNNALLDAAIKVSTLRRIVFTSTILATMPLPPRDQGPYNAESRFPYHSGPFSSVYDAYQAAKMELLDRSHRVVANERPSFDVINIFPGYTFGQSPSAQKASDMFASSNALLLALLKGRQFGSQRTAGVAHLDDVVHIHIRALSDEIPGNTDYGVTSPAEYDMAIQIAKKHFPTSFNDGTFNENGSQPSERVTWDAAATEEFFGVKFKSYDEMVKDAVSQYLELLSTEH